ncbi:MAG TPA: cytochrome c oxidase assembly protein, partial [Candidatus Thioglobus sp.]|nr:cytochrome c oxidase assembly protein [Candidatus Thioglobus sp.]
MAELERKKITKRFWITLVSAPILMLLFAVFVMPPLYEVLCDITGFNGTTGKVDSEQQY